MASNHLHIPLYKVLFTTAPAAANPNPRRANLFRLADILIPRGQQQRMRIRFLKGACHNIN